MSPSRLGIAQLIAWGTSYYLIAIEIRDVGNNYAAQYSQLRQPADAAFHHRVGRVYQRPGP